jgi:hypothetical protein
MSAQSNGGGKAMRYMKLFLVASLALWQGSAFGEMNHNHASEAACEQTDLRCASKVTPAFGPDGTLWLAWIAGGQVLVASSGDEGHSFSEPVQITREKLDLDWGPDSRPKIVVDREGRIALAFSFFKDKSFNGQVLFTRSTDGGKSFAEPQPITPDKESQRFETLALDADGTVFAAWLDKRNRAAARDSGQKYEGAGLVFAVSKDGGTSYSDAVMVKDNTCECCRIAVAFDGPGKPVVLFRNIFEGSMRDHAITAFKDLTTPGEVHRVSVDDWQLSACPHQGPSLAIAPAGTFHAVWSTNGKVRKGLFYARSADGGQTFSDPLPIGQADHAPSRPYVLAGPGELALVWKEFDGEKTTVDLMVSHDDGQSWSAPRTIATTTDASDHPLLISDGRHTYLSWMTKADGFRFQPIEEE